MGRQVRREPDVKLAMLTGDNAGTARRIAEELGLDIVLAAVLPGQKASAVRELQEQEHGVGMVGDGVNDALLLRRTKLHEQGPEMSDRRPVPASREHAAV